MFRLDGLVTPSNRNVRHNLTELAIVGDFVHQIGVRIGHIFHVTVARIATFGHRRGAGGEVNRTVTDCHVSLCGGVHGHGVVVGNRRTKAGVLNHHHVGCERSLDNVLEATNGDDITSKDGAGAGVERQRGRANRIPAGLVDEVSRAATGGVGGNLTGVVKAKAHEAVNHTVTEKASGTGFVNLEQAGLLALEVGFRLVAKNQVEVRRRAVVLEDSRHV